MTGRLSLEPNAEIVHNCIEGVLCTRAFYSSAAEPLPGRTDGDSHPSAVPFDQAVSNTFTDPPESIIYSIDIDAPVIEQFCSKVCVCVHAACKRVRPTYRSRHQERCLHIEGN